MHRAPADVSHHVEAVSVRPEQGALLSVHAPPGKPATHCLFCGGSTHAQSASLLTPSHLFADPSSCSPCATSASPDACAERHDLSVAVTRCATHGGSVSAARVAVRARDVLCANAELSSTRGCASRALVRHATVRLSSSPTAPSPVLFAPSDESPRRSESSCHNQHHPCGPVHSTTPRSCL